MNRTSRPSSRAPRKPGGRIAPQAHQTPSTSSSSSTTASTASPTTATTASTTAATTASTAAATPSSNPSPATSSKPIVRTRAPLDGGTTPPGPKAPSEDMPSGTSRGTPLQERSANPAPEIAMTPLKSSTAPIPGGYALLVKSIETERTLMDKPNGSTRAVASKRTEFKAFVDLLLQTAPRDWAELFNDTRLCTAASASVAKIDALHFLKEQTDSHGLPKSKHDDRYLALVAACLLGYDLHALWYGTALNGCPPGEAAIWRALTGNVSGT
jgi:hypothetical protein